MQKNFEAVQNIWKRRDARDVSTTTHRKSLLANGNLFSLPSEILVMIFSSKALTSFDLMALELTCSTFRNESLTEQAAKIKLGDLKTSTQDLPSLSITSRYSSTCAKMHSCHSSLVLGGWKTGGFR